MVRREGSGLSPHSIGCLLKGRPPWPVVRGSLVLLGAVLLLVPSLSGCVSAILPTRPATGLEFACAVLDPEEAERVVVHAWVGDDVTTDVRPAHQSFGLVLGSLGARQGGLGLRWHDGPRGPPEGWNATSLREWADDLAPEFGDEVQLHVVWAATLPDGASSLVAAPGVVAISDQAVREGASRLGVPAPDVARAVLLHVAGHALGTVNQGIPVQDADLQAREGPAGHDPDPASVLNAAWEDAATMRWAENATYAAYGPALLDDWAAAVRPGGVCAA